MRVVIGIAPMAVRSLDKPHTRGTPRNGRAPPEILPAQSSADGATRRASVLGIVGGSGGTQAPTFSGRKSGPKNSSSTSIDPTFYKD